MLPEPDGLSAQRHLQELHQGADGWITLARREPSGHWRQHHYRYTDALHELDDWLGVDAFFSQSTFYKPARRLENLRQLRALWVDLDVYRLDLHPEQVLMELEMEHYRRTIPEPGLEVWSGRGLALIWPITPERGLAVPRWQALQTHLCQSLARWGADPASSDPCRVLRLADSVNRKNGAVVQAFQRHTLRPTLDSLMREYLPELRPGQPARRLVGTNRPVTQMFSLYSLHYERMMDVLRLCELRSWHMNGYRAKALFLYRYWNCLYQRDPKEALRQTLELNTQFAEPLAMREVVGATRSAEKAWREWEQAQAAGMGTSRDRSVRNGYNYTNESLIDLLRITPEEQRHMKTIISNMEHNRRVGDKRRDGRPSQAEARDTRLAAVQEALQAHPEASQRELARILGLQLFQVQRALAHLERISDHKPRFTLGGEAPAIIGRGQSDASE